MKSKAHLVNKNLSFVTSGNGVLLLPDTWNFLENTKEWFIFRSVGQSNSLYITVWQQIFTNMRVESRSRWNKNMLVEFFRMWQNPKSIKNWLFLAVVRSLQKPEHGSNLDSSLLSILFIGNDFKVHIFQKWQKNLPYYKMLTFG